MASTRLQFCLTGPSPALDPQRAAVRGDLADVALAGQLFAPHYAEPLAMRCCIDQSAVAAQPGGETLFSLAAGEIFMVLDLGGGAAWGWRESDHQVGYVDAAALELV